MSAKDRIIDLLISKKGEIISGEEISSAIGISRTAIWKHIKSLREEGYKIESQQGRGHRLVRLTDKPLEREVQRGLTTKRLGREIHYFDVATSTNDLAKEMARKGCREGTVIITGEQTKGRGRIQRTWQSPEGGLYLSIVLRPSLALSDMTLITLLSGLAVAKALKKLYQLDVKLKWPNDLMVSDRKIGGILSEAEGEADKLRYVIVGIGVNVNTSVKTDIQTSSMAEVLGVRVSLVEIAREIIQELEKVYDGLVEGSGGLLKEYIDISHTISRKVKATCQNEVITGEAVGIDSDGGLIVRTAEGAKRKILSGDCAYIR